MLAVEFGSYHVADSWLGVFIGGGILWAILGYFLAGTKGNGCWGCGLGCLLGPLGILLAMLIPASRRY
ncbi:hypothetical protein IIA79_02820 [bacterium]|nr:hypothetical protein [bacterium]